MCLVTCKEFLEELNAYLDDSIDPETVRSIGRHT